MKIIINNLQKKFALDEKYYISVTKKIVEKYIKRVANRNDLELYIKFVTSGNIKKLKNKLFGIDIFTDVIAIPIDTDFDGLPGIFGEIFICPSVALDNSKTYKTTHDEEILLLIVHGLLHLIGYEDHSESDKKLMRKKENEVLRYLETSC